MAQIQKLKEKLQYGDYTTLGKMLGINSHTAKMRVNRGDKEATSALEKIFAAREELVKEFQQNQN